ncbi:MAG: group II truncated hemoglobin [Nitrospira sp.]|nr:group II truncated hemoglobin [Nitrospira sp.]
MPLEDQDRSDQTIPYQAAGELVGITKLVDEFYANMDTLPEAETIRKMHPPDLTESRRKLTYFLCGWLGGPRLFQQHYGPISIPGAHKRFPIGYEERDAWLLCMQRALATQPYTEEFKQYLLAALSIPAERVRQVNMGEF